MNRDETCFNKHDRISLLSKEDPVQDRIEKARLKWYGGQHHVLVPVQVIRLTPQQLLEKDTGGVQPNQPLKPNSTEEEDKEDEDNDAGKKHGVRRRRGILKKPCRTEARLINSQSLGYWIAKLERSLEGKDRKGDGRRTVCVSEKRRTDKSKGGIMKLVRERSMQGMLNQWPD
uniref:Uncharacterized protein n=1 Tax=Timema genevievae TaxID=629358 RepID=A0A7R9K4M7_TIMGE|nr:unnamed protein product [Timema genevievae]